MSIPQAEYLEYCIPDDGFHDPRGHGEYAGAGTRAADEHERGEIRESPRP